MTSRNSNTGSDELSGSPLSRRAFTTAVGATAATAAVGIQAAAPAAAAPASDGVTRERPFRAARGRHSRRPNILFILGDDLGWADLSSYGAPHIRTPNLDRLGRQGVRFTDAYSGSATCSPTRFSLYTGRYPGRTKGGLAEPIADRSVGLEPTHPTLASLLRGAGYSTALIGKWHCGYLPDYSPTRSGWDEFFGNFGGALEYYSKLGLGGEYDLYEGDAEYKDLRYYTRVLTERASEYVQRDHDKPWLLNLNFTTPHWPWIADGDTEASRRDRPPDQGRRPGRTLERRRRFGREVHGDGRGPGPLRRRGAAGAEAVGPGGGHPGLLRQRQRGRAVLLQLAAVRQQELPPGGRHPRPLGAALARPDRRSPGQRSPCVLARLDGDPAGARRSTAGPRPPAGRRQPRGISAARRDAEGA